MTSGYSTPVQPPAADEPSPTPEEKYLAAVDFEGARLEVLPLYNKVVPGFVNKVPILFQFITGVDPNKKRESFSLSIVLDTSGSMEGSRLKNCKAAIEQLIECADDDDRLSLVIYGDTASIIFENIRCGDVNARKDMKTNVADLSTRGSTNLYDGLKLGYDILQKEFSRDMNKHLFLLSDGQVNHGQIQSTQGILDAVAKWDEKIPILSYGIGDGFNEKLMSPLGQVHRGSRYFYIETAADVERLIGRGVKALTGAVARNMKLNIAPKTPGVLFPDNMIDGSVFPLVRERSVIQFLVELEMRPEIDWDEADDSDDADGAEDSSQSESKQAAATSAKQSVEESFEIVSPPAAGPANDAAAGPGQREQSKQKTLCFRWSVENNPSLGQKRGLCKFFVCKDRSFREHGANAEVLTFLDVKKGCDLRRNAATSATPKQDCEQALKLFEASVARGDRFGFAEEWAAKTKALLQDSSAWRHDGTADSGAAKHLGVAYARAGVVEEEDDEEEMDFDLFG
eukprot:TRINITY_DN6683_c0_g1_i1.p1 TRINITY_DN6683_c0_g1~~TRINITY_DN6683_c0_g1_i1.p1  ORF type:complete len:512 (-),score=109.64 TRINITY_DN6683_c0_g1_i1:477-2012(-)